MTGKKEVALAPAGREFDPFAVLRQMTTELDRAFEQPFWPSFRAFNWPEGAIWAPKVDVFEKENRFVTRIDLPGVKKENVNVEVKEGRLNISGERKVEKEETKENVFRTEREYGQFHRTVPLPDGVKPEEIVATFADGVLEVSVPLPARTEPTVQKVEINAPAKAAKSAA